MCGQKNGAGLEQPGGMVYSDKIKKSEDMEYRGEAKDSSVEMQYPGEAKDSKGTKDTIETIYYVALGDSLTEGPGVSREENFVGVYRSLMEQRLKKKVVVYEAGISGETTRDILGRLETDERLQQAISRANILTLTAGGNDLLQAAREFLAKSDAQVLKQAHREYVRNIRLILDRIETIGSVEHERKGQKTNHLIVRILNMYNPFPMIEDTIYWVNRFNREWNAFETSFRCVVDIYEAFRDRTDELISDDMVHPNALGYRVMAEVTDAAGYFGLDD